MIPKSYETKLLERLNPLITNEIIVYKQIYLRIHYLNEQAICSPHTNPEN